MGNSSSQDEGTSARHASKPRARSSSKAAEMAKKSVDTTQKSVASTDSANPHFAPSKPVAVKSRPAPSTTADIPQNSVPVSGTSFGAVGSHSSYQHTEYSHLENADAAKKQQDDVTPTSPKTTTASDVVPAAAPTPSRSALTGDPVTAKFKATMSTNNSSSTSSASSAERPAPIRRKSTLLLQGEHEPEVDEDMEFHKLNLQPGVQPNATKPLSRAGSGDEIQLGEEYYNESKYETLISWQQGGDKVYVTGSFTGWRRMIKLSKREDNSFSVLLKLPAGTHRMRFVVDNELRCSDFMPSATDSMGNLVNYIEVGLDSDTDMSTEPLHRTTSNYTEQRRARDSAVAQDQKWVESQEQLKESRSSADQVDKAPEPAASTDVEMILTADDEALNGGGYERFHEEPPADPVYTFTSDIPSVFTDPEVMEQFVASEFVTPPQLPPHLESVILNSNSNEKDNNSVLPIPNHVVLNHLATTSIKHNVLAVASISRYSRKYVTQILYAPL